MCDACLAAQLAGSANPARRRLWELEPGWHCSVIGTCLSVSELRRILRKAGLRFPGGNPTDYEVHGAAVRESRQRSPMSRAVHKLLDRKHRRAVRRFASTDGEEALATLWDDARDSGDIAGPYWALLTHPGCCPDLAARAFAEVHMLSHLVGAANRADIRALARLEEERAALDAAVREGREALRRVVRERDGEAQARRVAETKAGDALARAQAAEARARALEDGTAAAECEERCAGLTLRLEDAETECLRLSALLRRREAEVRRLERRLHHGMPAPAAAQDDGPPSRPEPATAPHCAAAEAPSLDGRSILYVGGRPQQAGHLRALVEGAGGAFLYHDGGIEDGHDRLHGALSQADAVLFPVTCVSHNAVGEIKRHCRACEKPCVALRSAGLTALQDGLRRVVPAAALS